MRITSAFALLIFALCLTATAAAQVIYVDLNTPGPEHDGLTWDTAFLTIQEGVDAATPNGEVWVADGIYVENVVMGEGVATYGGFLGAEEGGYETELYERAWTNNVAVIDGNQSGSCVTMASDSRLDGFTVTNGSGTLGEYDWMFGAGIYCRSATGSVAIANCMVAANSTGADGAGGGIYCQDSSPEIVNNVIYGNSAEFGGGVVLYTSSALVTNNTVFGNAAASQGGGFWCVVSGTPSISNNIVIENVADEGAGIFCYFTDPVLSHNDFWNNSPDNYYGCEPGAGDISANPLLGDPGNGDFHIDRASPCIDVGDNDAPALPLTDFEGDSRVIDGDNDDVAVVDIGADERVPGVVAVIDLPEGDVHIGLGEYVEFAGTATAGDGEIVHWLWTFGEGSGIDDMHVEDPGLLQFKNPGRFVVTFNAEDDDGNWDPTPDQRTVWVKEVVYVDWAAPGPSHDGTSWDTALLTIQEGVDSAALVYGQVWVADGSYVENVAMASDVAIYGGFLGAEPGGYETSLDQRDWANNVATIDGNQSGSCVVMAVDAGVDGFTITNGRAYEGGGIRCVGLGETGTIANNAIIGNEVRYFGSGGGISCEDGSSPVVVNNVISDNVVRFYQDDGLGAGIYCGGGSSPTVANNTITRNRVENGGGGGIYCGGSCSPAISNNIVTHNSASRGGGIYGSGTLRCNDFWNNAGGNYWGCEPGEGDISADPLFVDPDADDFHIDDASPCVDAGDNYAPGLPPFDFDGDPRVVDGDDDEVAVVDIGADELVPGVVAVIDLPEGDVTILEHEAVEFAGTAYDRQGQPIVDYLWSFGEGSGIPDSHEEDPGEVVFGIPGVFEVTFNAQTEDGRWDVSPEHRTITVEFVPPDAAIDLPVGHVIIAVRQWVEFAGTATDENGEIVDWLWTFGEGSGIDDIHVEDPGEVQFNNVGVFVVTFDAQDNHGNWDPLPDERIITVEPGYPDAVIDLPVGDVVIHPGDYVEFAGTATDENGQIVAWLWTFGEGSGIDDMHVEDPGPVQFNNRGAFTVTFNAQDDEGNWDPSPDERAIRVGEMVYVDQSAPGPEHDGTSWDTAFLTIQEGVDAAAAVYGPVWVADGIYIENVVMAEDVRIFGGFLGAEPGGYETELEQRDFVSNVTTIDGNQSGSCVTMAADARVDGFRITNGSGTEDGSDTYGGGFYCADLCDGAAIENNTIVANSAVRGGGSARGGGIYCSGSSVTIANNTISDNNAEVAYSGESYGGGVYCSGSSPTIAGNTISGNTASAGDIDGRGYGGGIYCSGSFASITDNTISRNTAQGTNDAGHGYGHGGGVHCSGPSATIAGNTISGNTADGRGWSAGWAAGGGLYCEGASLTLAGNAISGNTASAGAAAVSSGAYGGGAYCSGSSPAVTNNTIWGNTASARGGDAGHAAGHGGGLYCAAASATVAGNFVSGNAATGWNAAEGGAGGHGGGVYCAGSSPAIANNTISGNTASAWAPLGSVSSGGGVHVGNCESTVTNNAVTENSASSGGGICCGGPPATLSHNDFWSNIPNDYEGCVPGEGDISADPLFANPDAGDWHLTSESPCIDAGTNVPGLPETDWDDEDRIVNGVVDIGADEYLTHYAEAPDPQPECGGPLFGGSQTGFPAWVWFSIPLTPDCPIGYGCADPDALLGFECDGRLWYWDKYLKSAQVYQPPFLTWDLAVGHSYLLYLEADVINPSYEGITPFIPWAFEFKLGRQGWTWVGMPGLAEVTGDDFMSSVTVKYPSDDTAEHRTAQADYDATPDNWVSWGWPYWNTWLQAPETFTPYAPFGHNTCYPWLGYRVWINVGAAVSEDDPDQVTLIWP